MVRLLQRVGPEEDIYHHHSRAVVNKPSKRHVRGGRPRARKASAERHHHAERGRLRSRSADRRRERGKKRNKGKRERQHQELNYLGRRHSDRREETEWDYEDDECIDILQCIDTRLISYDESSDEEISPEQILKVVARRTAVAKKKNPRLLKISSDDTLACQSVATPPRLVVCMRGDGLDDGSQGTSNITENFSLGEEFDGDVHALLALLPLKDIESEWKPFFKCGESKEDADIPVTLSLEVAQTSSDLCLNRNDMSETPSTDKLESEKAPDLPTKATGGYGHSMRMFSEKGKSWKKNGASNTDVAASGSPAKPKKKLGWFAFVRRRRGDSTPTNTTEKADEEEEKVTKEASSDDTCSPRNCKRV